MVASWHASDRTRFIVRRGILQSGVAIGIVAAWLGAVPWDQTPGEGARRVVALLFPPALAFLEWGIGGGWIIGAVLWTLAQRRAAPRHRAPRTQRRRR